MATKLICALYRQRYLAWGVVVVSSVTVFTGAFISSVIGYTLGVGLMHMVNHLFK